MGGNEIIRRPQGQGDEKAPLQEVDKTLAQMQRVRDSEGDTFLLPESVEKKLEGIQALVIELVDLCGEISFERYKTDPKDYATTLKEIEGSMAHHEISEDVLTTSVARRKILNALGAKKIELQDEMNDIKTETRGEAERESFARESQ